MDGSRGTERASNVCFSSPKGVSESEPAVEGRAASAISTSRPASRSIRLRDEGRFDYVVGEGEARMYSE
jgi:hypothetical protein